MMMHDVVSRSGASQVSAFQRFWIIARALEGAKVIGKTIPR
jgi:hypothetical protein